MPRWINNPKDNCIDVMNSVIKNLNPKTRDEILNEVISLKNINSKKDIEKFIRNKLGLHTTVARHTQRYWLLRGWSKEESYIKSKENKQSNNKSVYSRDYWLKKVNLDTGNLYTLEEADFERNSRRPIKKEYWSKKGYSDAEAQQLSKEVKIHNNNSGSKKSASSIFRRVTSKRCIEYYVVRGYSETEANKLVSNNQTYFSKDVCIEKYGEERGLKIWQDRQDRWQETLNSKSDEEKARINRLKLSKGISVSLAEKEIIEEVKKIHNDLLIIPQFTLSVNNKKQYVYDIASNKKIIEYNGDFWHCNPKKYSADYVNPRTKLTALEKWRLDQEKIQFAQAQGYEVMVVWESDFKTNKEKVLTKCIQFLTQ